MAKLKLFFGSMFSEWGTRLSGPASVPFTILALWVSSPVQKVAYGLLAVVLGFFTAFTVWLKEHNEKIAGIAEKTAQNEILARKCRELEKEYHDERPILGLEVIRSSNIAEFSLRHLSGRPAQNVCIDPVRSLAGKQLLKFRALAFVAPSSVKKILQFDVLEGESDVPTDPRILQSLEMSGMLDIFLADKLSEVHAPRYEMTLRFKDRDEERTQTFRVTFDLKTAYQTVEDIS